MGRPAAASRSPRRARSPCPTPMRCASGSGRASISDVSARSRGPRLVAIGLHVDEGMSQADLFGAPEKMSILPEGFRYQPDLISPREEQSLLERIRELPFREFEFQGYIGK